MPTLAPLPIDEALPELLATLQRARVAVLVAPPGAGKTTRVPGAVLDAGLSDGHILVLAPRRLAVRLAATRVAEERGGEVGGEVGYEIRFERKVSPHTKVTFVTEGVLTARLRRDPGLAGVGCVIIDEFHERHLDGDVALAWVHALRQTRPDLRLIVMSATLEAEPVAGFLGASIIRSEGRTFPITIEHAEGPTELALPAQVRGALRRLLNQGLDGDVLVFLPGAGEIRKLTEELAELAGQHQLLLLPLHGDLTMDEQQRAVRKAAQRKVILATNVAETSVTIDGVVAVIDSGLARVARHSPWSGLPTLLLEPISKASATQRAGRAGRTKPGHVIRLYTKHDFDGRRAFDAAEVARADLADVALQLRGLGLHHINQLAWFEAPPEAAALAAETLLRRLGAVTASGAISALGQAMLQFAVHPRLARLVVEAEARGAGPEGCLIAAIVSSKEFRLERRGPTRRQHATLSSSSDLIDDLDALLDAKHAGYRTDRLRQAGLDVTTVQQIGKLATQLERNLGRGKRVPPPANDALLDEALEISILAAYPDRVARRRAPRSPDVAFAGGGGGTLAATSSVLDAMYLVAVDTAETGQRGATSKVSIRRASAIDPSWLIELFADELVERDELCWHAERERVERASQLLYDGMVISEQRDVEGARTPQGAALLAKQLTSGGVAGLARYLKLEELAQWRARLAVFAKATNDASLEPTDEALLALLSSACDGLVSFAELRATNLMRLLEASLGDKQRKLEAWVPSHLDLPRRKRVPIHYEPNQAPWLAARMQDFFGLARAPSVCEGRVPLVLHLLAPNQRPVQVTQDLPGFWVKHYPALRSQLMRRYPRHQWPEDPTTMIRDDGA